MRTLARNQSGFYYRNYSGEYMPLDDEMNLTGEPIPTYSDPVYTRGYVTGAKGDAEGAEFGTDVKYDKTIILAGTDWDITENTMLNVDDPDPAHTPDYKVVRIARFLNHTTLAVAKVAR